MYWVVCIVWCWLVRFLIRCVMLWFLVSWVFWFVCFLIVVWYGKLGGGVWFG